MECFEESNFSFGLILIFCQLPGAQNLKSLQRRAKLRFLAFSGVPYGFLEVCQPNHCVFLTSLWNVLRSQPILPDFDFLTISGGSKPQKSPKRAKLRFLAFPGCRRGSLRYTNLITVCFLHQEVTSRSYIKKLHHCGMF